MTPPYKYIDGIRKERERLEKAAEDSKEYRDGPPQHSCSLMMTGHLFDTGLINKVFDLAEGRGCNFEMIHCDILPNSDKKDKDTASQLDDFANLKKFQNKLLNSIVICGLPGIKAVTFRNDKQYVEPVGDKYEPVNQFVLDTDGSNFIKVMNHPAVDGTKVYSTNVWDVYEVLGIEATRAILFNEISSLFESVGVTCRHLCLLCDVMTRFGRLMSIDRYGININRMTLVR